MDVKNRRFRKKDALDSVYLFRIRPETFPEGLVLHLWGALDAHTTPEFEECFTRHLSGAPPVVVIECEDLHYVSSAGYGAFIEAAHECRSRGIAMRAAQVTPAVDRVFQMLGLPKMIALYPTVAAALTGGPSEIGGAGQGDHHA